MERGTYPFRLRGSSSVARIIFATVLVTTPLLTAAQGDIELQLAIVNEQLAETPDNYRLHAKAGELHGMHEDWQLAFTSLIRAKSLAPDSSAAILDLRIAELLYRAGNSEQALPYVERYLDSHQDSSTGWRVHANIQGSLNDIDAALESFDHSIRYAIMPTPELFFERARLLEKQPRRSGELLQGIDEGIQRLGPLVSLLQYAIEIDQQRGNHASALARVDALPEPIRQQPRWLLRRSVLLNESGRVLEAEVFNRMAMRAIEKLPAQRQETDAYVALRSEIESSYAAMTDRSY